MEHKTIQRGGIKSAGYDARNRVLEIEFSTGNLIRHTGVGDEIARRFMSSGSPMSYYRDNIEEEFPQSRVR